MVQLAEAQPTRDEIVIHVALELGSPRVEFCVPAEEDSLPILRQALRAFAATDAISESTLEDAELAVTEAVANVVAHAYGPAETGTIDASFVLDGDGLRATIRDAGRGPTGTGADTNTDVQHGFGLSIISAVAREAQVVERPEGGTEVTMTFAAAEDGENQTDEGAGAAETAKRVLRRVVAVVAAQTDVPLDRVTEALLVAELTIGHALPQILGDSAELSLRRASGGFELGISPLPMHGAERVIEASRLPAVGALIERLSDEVSTQPWVNGGGRQGERLVLQIAPPARRQPREIWAISPSR